MNRLVSINFHFSVWLSILGGILLFNYPDWFFDDPESLYGPLKNNLLIVVVYLVINQLACWFLRYTKRTRGHEALFMGFMFVLVAGGMKFYASINGLPLLDWLPLVALYIGVSHALYYFQVRAVENSRRRR